MADGPTILLLALEFPPVARISALRALCFAKYLPEYGVRPVVVTADKPSLEAWFGPAPEDALLRQLPPRVPIHRLPCPHPGPRSRHRLVRWASHFFAIDEDIGQHWEHSLLRGWDRIVDQAKPAAIWASIPPYSIGTLAVSLARRSGLPLILDFRDHWSQFCAGARPTWFHYRLQLQRERTCIEQAAAVVGVTHQVICDLQAAHPHVEREKFHVVPNGYDSELPSFNRASPASANDLYVIGYVGSFYYTPEARATVMEPWWRRPTRHWFHYAPRREDWLYRSPYFFFGALRRLLEQHPSLRNRVRVQFVGDTPDWLRRQVKQFALEDVVEHLGRRTHPACLEFQARCNALLVTSAKVIGGRDYCIAGKTFEYVAVGRPILAFVTEGEQREFLQASGVAAICDPDDLDHACVTLMELISGRFQPKPNIAFLRGYHRRDTARKLSELLRELASARCPC